MGRVRDRAKALSFYLPVRVKINNWRALTDHYRRLTFIGKKLLVVCIRASKRFVFESAARSELRAGIAHFGQFWPNLPAGLDGERALEQRLPPISLVCCAARLIGADLCAKLNEEKVYHFGGRTNTYIIDWQLPISDNNYLRLASARCYRLTCNYITLIGSRKPIVWDHFYWIRSL